MDPKEKIIIALDVGTKREALALAGALQEARVFKVGMELFTAEGPALLEETVRLGKRPFLDLKYHDIPNTVAGAVRSATRSGVSMLTLHTSGGTGDDGRGRPGRAGGIRPDGKRQAASPRGHRPDEPQGRGAPRVGIATPWPIRSSGWPCWPRTQGWTESSAPPTRSRSSRESAAANSWSSLRGSGPPGQRPRIRSAS